MHRRVLDLDIDIGNYINTATRLDPKIHDEYMKRRTYQAVGISLCHALLALYQQAMKNLHIKGNKYTNEIRHLGYLIECLTKWQDQDDNIYGPITSMDNLYKSLFGVYIPQPKLTRDEIIYNLEGGNYKCLM